MKYFHGKNKVLRYFEGWYFKQQEGEETISFIPGIQVDENGSRLAFIQVITKEESHYFTFPINKFYANEDTLFVKIDKNLFTRRGVYLDINQENSRKEMVCIRGHFKYGSLTKVNYPVMGPLQYIPLPCKHMVISMRHLVEGNLQLNKKYIVMSHGIGYLEADYGTSFPRNYLWTQANATKTEAPQIFASIATLPLCKCEMLGCIAVILYQGKQYRMATYLGAKVLIVKETLAILRQGRWTLCIHMDKERRAQELLAPYKGELSRKIKEDVKCVVRFTFYCGRNKVFDWTTRNASIEFVVTVNSLVNARCFT